jgi:ribosomal protein L32
VLPFLTTHEQSLRFEVLDEDLRKVEELAARKSALLQTLRDVEFDYETGKITENDYRDLKARYEREAIEVMRELDNLHGGRGWEEAIDAELDQRVAKIRAEREKAPAESTSPELIDCPECGHEMQANARFCSQCGTTLADVSTSKANKDDQTSPMESRALPNSGSEVAT